MNVDKMGRGLEAILGSSLSSATNTETSQETKDTESNFIMLDPRVLKPNPYQPRRTFDDETLEELSSSIKAHGVIQPVIAQKDIDGSYFIVAGERRTRASILAGLEKIPVVLSDIKEESKLEVALIENIQRENLNPIEEAESYQHLIYKGLTHDEIAQIMGKSRPYITNLVRLLQLPDFVLKAVKEGRISQAHARLLIKLKEKDQKKWLEKIISSDISVRKFEKLLQTSTTKPKSENVQKIFIEEEEENLKKLLGVDVKISLSKKQTGKISISFSNQEEYERIINSLK